MAPPYTTSQRTAITQFSSFTSQRESTAAKFLKQNAWNLEQAVDSLESMSVRPPGIFNHRRPATTTRTMAGPKIDDEQTAPTELWDLQRRLQENHEERLLCAAKIHYLSLAIGPETSIFIPGLLPQYRFLTRHFSASHTKYVGFLERHILPDGFGLGSGWKSMRLLYTDTLSTVSIKGLPKQTIHTRKVLAKVALWKGEYLQAKWNHEVQDSIAPKWIQRSMSSSRAHLDTPRTEEFLGYVDHLTKQLSSSVTLCDRRYKGALRIENGRASSVTKQPTSSGQVHEIEVAEYLLDVIELRRDGQIDHQSLVRTIVAVLRRPELRTLDFDEDLLDTYFASSEMEKMDTNLMVGDILGTLRLDGCIKIPVTVLSGSRHDPQATSDYRLLGPGTSTDVDGLKIHFKRDRLNNTFQNFTACLESGEFTLNFANGKSYDSSYFQSNRPAAPNATSAQGLRRIFDKYLEDPKNNPDTIGVEGAMRYLTDVKVSLEEVAMLAVSELLGSPTQGEFTRDGFCNGWKDLRCDTIQKQADYIDVQIRKKLHLDQELFRRTYRHSFILARASPAQKSLPLETATEFWRLLFSPDHGGYMWDSDSTPWLAMWIDFLESKWKKGVNRDMWDQLLVFVFKTVGDEMMSFWSEDGAWPGAIDEFVLYMREKRRPQQDPEADAMEE